MIKKGSYGYIRTARIRKTLLALVLTGAAALVYLGARHYLQTSKNIFTIMAALMCLPAGRAILDAVMFFRAPCCSPGAMREIEEKIGKTPGAYELYLTTYEKNFALSHVCVASGSVLALTEDPACDQAGGQAHIRRSMETEGFRGYTVKIFSDRKKYLQRLSDISAKEQERDPHADGILRLLKQIAL